MQLAFRNCRPRKIRSELPTRLLLRSYAATTHRKWLLKQKLTARTLRLRRVRLTRKSVKSSRSSKRTKKLSSKSLKTLHLKLKTSTTKTKTTRRKSEICPLNPRLSSSSPTTSSQTLRRTLISSSVKSKTKIIRSNSKTLKQKYSKSVLPLLLRRFRTRTETLALVKRKSTRSRRRPKNLRSLNLCLTIKSKTSRETLLPVKTTSSTLSRRPTLWIKTSRSTTSSTQI